MPDTRTINIALVEQIPQERTIRFTPDLSSLDGAGVLLEAYYEVTTDEDGIESIELPVKPTGSIRYEFEIPRTGGKSTGRFYLTAGDPIDLDALILAGGAATDSIIDYIDAQITAALAAIDDLLALKANLASPAFTGNPTAPTQAAGNNTTRIATTEFVRTEVAALIASAPGTLDTLDELAAAFGDDPNFAATMVTALAGKQPLDADLTAIAALGTTAFGRGLLELANLAALKAVLALVKADVGLGNAENTSDANKPVSTAQQAALDLKLNANLTNFVGVTTTFNPTSPPTATELPNEGDWGFHVDGGPAFYFGINLSSGIRFMLLS